MILDACLLGLPLLTAFSHDLHVSATLGRIDLLRDDAIGTLTRLDLLIGPMSRAFQSENDLFERLNKLVFQTKALKNDLDEITDLKAELQPKTAALQRRTSLPIYRTHLERFKNLDALQSKLIERVRIFEEKLLRIRLGLEGLFHNRAEESSYKQLMQEALDLLSLINYSHF